MIESFYSGTAGLSAHQQSMEVVANNIANVNTTSYKAKKQTFGSLLSASEVRPETPNSENLLAGAGSRIDQIKTDYSGGSCNQTASMTDYYIDGDGFFAVADNDGNLFYTRDGNFHKEITENGTILATGDGMTVLSANGGPCYVDAEGNAQDPVVVTFANNLGLSSYGQNLFTTTASSGNPTVTDTNLIKGELEGSNVNLSTEMVEMITSQRGLQLNSRLVQTADAIEDMINNMAR